MGVRDIVIGGAVTLIIGGTAYTVNQTDVVDNFADDTGLSQEQAEEYVSNVRQEDLISYGEIGDSFVEDGNLVLDLANGVDCVNYEYEWESPTLSCDQGKAQLLRIGNNEVALGTAYKKLGSETATESDIPLVILNIDKVNSDYELEIIDFVLTPAEITEAKNANSYNKATLEAVLEAD